MTTTLCFKIRVIKNQITACLREIAKGVKSFVDRLILLENQMEILLSEQEAEKVEKYIELCSYRRAGVNAYLVEEGKDHTHNMYGEPVDEENLQRAYRAKSHTVLVRIDNLPDAIYRFVEAGGSTGKKVVKGWLKIHNGVILEQSDNLASLIVGEDAQSLPELQGSQKQIEWAIALREKAIAKYKQSKQSIPLSLTQTQDAKWFIENRNSL
ncbi:MAG: hypothetical protein ACKPE3_00075 [Sphaerospermopsis kisseleviana]